MSETNSAANGAEERDLIDELIDDLNDGVDGVTFDRDVLDTNRPDDWAAVEMTGDGAGEWADGRLIDQTVALDIWVCVSERGSRILTEVQDVLQYFAEYHDIGWKFVSRNYLYDLDKVMWRWTVTLWGPIELPEEDEPEEPDDLPFTEPEEDPEEDDPEWPEIDHTDGW